MSEQLAELSNKELVKQLIKQAEKVGLCGTGLAIDPYVKGEKLVLEKFHRITDEAIRRLEGK